MLERLLGSKARVKLLKIFLLHPNDKYYIRQLARDLNLQVNSVRRELDNLENLGILISDIKLDGAQAEGSADDQPISYINGNIALAKKKTVKKTVKKIINKQERKYYQTNQNFILYSEIKALIVRSQIFHERDFVNKLKQIGKIKLLILSGIFVHKSNSPVDILIVGRVNKPKLLSLVKLLEKELGLEVNFTIMEALEFKYRRDITDVFLYSILEGNKLVVIDDIGLTEQNFDLTLR